MAKNNPLEENNGDSMWHQTNMLEVILRDKVKKMFSATLKGSLTGSNATVFQNQLINAADLSALNERARQSMGKHWQE